MEPCPHLMPPTQEALLTFENPLKWSCQVCSSTDGVWVCLTCGHAGCGRRAHMPALGGGHSRHHYQTITSSSSNHTHTATTTTCCHDIPPPQSQPYPHAVCMDLVSRAVHCYLCDDYVISDAAWLAHLRVKLQTLETTQLSPMMNNDQHNENGTIEMEDVTVDETDSPIVLVLRRTTTSRKRQHSLDHAPHELQQQQHQDDENNEEDGIRQEADGTYPDTIIVSNDTTTTTTTLPGCTGLRNLGNTCYMNSVLQALSHNVGFRSFFRDFLRAAAPLVLGQVPGQVPMVKIDRQTTVKHFHHLESSSSFATTHNNTKHDNTSKESDVDDDENKEEIKLVTSDRLALTEAMHALLRVLWSGRWQAVSPRALVDAIWTHGGIFAARRQQDASEFLNFVLDRLDEELRPWNNNNNKNTTITTTTNNAHAPPTTTGPGTVLTDLFGLDQRQEVTCDGCSTKTFRTEPLLGMVLSLPPQPQQVLTLQSCMEYALASERLVGDNQFYCDKCDMKQDATKIVTLHRCPQTLVVSFCRTLWNKTKGLHKDSRRVQFPLELDASPWLVEKDDSGWEDVGGGGCHYRLTAIVSHSGTSPLCGHYIAWCRVLSEPPNNENDDEGNWYLFNDSHVSPAKEEQVLDTEAFILMYERRQIPLDKMELGG